MDSSFHEPFLCSMWYCLTAYHPWQNFQICSQSILSDPTTALSTNFMWYSKPFVVISAILTASPAVDSISRKHFRCSSVKNNPLSLQVLSRDCYSSPPSQGSTSNSCSLAISTASVVPSSTEVLNSLSSMRVGINFFRTPVHIDILTSSYESWMLLMTSRVLSRFSINFAQMCEKSNYLWQL